MHRKLLHLSLSRSIFKNLEFCPPLNYKVVCMLTLQIRSLSNTHTQSYIIKFTFLLRRLFQNSMCLTHFSPQDDLSHCEHPSSSRFFHKSKKITELFLPLRLTCRHLTFLFTLILNFHIPTRQSNNLLIITA